MNANSISEYAFGTIVAIVVMAVALACVYSFAYGVSSFVWTLERARCEAFARETGRTTRFAELPYWQIDCLVLASDGKWISQSALRDEVK